MAVSYEDSRDNDDACGQPGAMLALAFGAGSLLSLAYIGVRWLALPLAIHYLDPLRGH